MPGMGRFISCPSRCSSFTASRILCCCRLLLWSIQIMAGIRGCLSLSRATRPCICPENPTAFTWLPEIPAFSMASRIALLVCSHHTWALCWAMPFSGMATSYPREAVPAILPPGSIRITFTDEVPRSIPITYSMLISSPPLTGSAYFIKSKRLSCLPSGSCTLVSFFFRNNTGSCTCSKNGDGWPGDVRISSSEALVIPT